MACCVLLAATWGAALVLKAVLGWAMGRAGQAQAWRLTPQEKEG